MGYSGASQEMGATSDVGKKRGVVSRELITQVREELRGPRAEGGVPRAQTPGPTSGS